MLNDLPCWLPAVSGAKYTLGKKVRSMIGKVYHLLKPVMLSLSKHEYENYVI